MFSHFLGQMYGIYDLESDRRGTYIRPRPCPLAANLGFLGPLSLVAGMRVCIVLALWGPSASAVELFGVHVETYLR